MSNLIGEIANYSSLAALIWLVALTYLILKLNFKLNKFTIGTTRQSLVSALDEISKNQLQSKKNVQTLGENIVNLNKQQKRNFQKHTLVRFNPFEDTGGDQSFVLSLLNQENNGIVISSLHSKESTRIYAKPVIVGRAGNFQFSKEEKEVVEKTARQV